VDNHPLSLRSVHPVNQLDSRAEFRRNNQIHALLEFQAVNHHASQQTDLLLDQQCSQPYNQPENQVNNRI
jgi:hypothetical protein